MQMSMGYGMEQQMRASPALVALNNMLVLTTQEMQQLVQEELDENPALDRVESAELRCEMCGRILQHGVCYACLSADRDLWASERRLGATSASDLDPLMSAPAPRSVLRALESDLRATVDAADAPIAEFLIGSLDGHGLLSCTTHEIADRLRVSVGRVEGVLRRLQEIGPTGTGARSTQECLLLQIDQIQPADECRALLRRVVADHWEDLVAHRFTALSRALGVSYETINSLRDVMRSRLQPYPLAAASGDGDTANTPMIDVTIVPDGGRFVVEVAESRRYNLRLNPLYQQLSQAVLRGQAEINDEEREHLRSHVARARLFLTNLRQRRETIRKIAEYVVERQHVFLCRGIRHLKPLTRTEVGTAIGLNDSTVSRATAHKYVLLPSREIFPFANFFVASLSAKDVLKEIIDAETRPLTDDEIAAQMRSRGIDLARRTVAKYRGQIGIPPAALR